MRERLLPLILAGCALLACGRHDPGALVNNTDDTLSIILRLNRPPLPHCPDNYFRLSLLQGDSVNGLRLLDLDTASDLVTFDMWPHATIDLGTVRLDAERNDPRSWEFSEIHVSGKRFMLSAADTGLNNFIVRNRHLLWQDDYAFVIGAE